MIHFYITAYKLFQNPPTNIGTYSFNLYKLINIQYFIYVGWDLVQSFVSYRKPVNLEENQLCSTYCKCQSLVLQYSSFIYLWVKPVSYLMITRLAYETCLLPHSDCATKNKAKIAYRHGAFTQLELSLI